MSKLKGPILALSARGTLGNAVTFQHLPRLHIVRKKPTPSDPYSLAQAYQRWLYRDYAYLWTLQSSATRQHYATAGSRYHLTGFQHWMKAHLTSMSDIVAWYRLDPSAHSIAHDSSLNNNPGTIFGASPTNLAIDGAYSFDGVDDYINCGTDPVLDISRKDHTIEFFASFTGNSDFNTLISSGNSGFFKDHPFAIVWRNSHLRYVLGTGTSYFYSTMSPDPPLNTLAHFALVKSGTTYSWYYNGSPASSAIIDQTPAPFSRLLIGALVAANWHIQGVIDNLVLYSRALTQAEVFSHSLRRYPP